MKYNELTLDIHILDLLIHLMLDSVRKHWSNRKYVKIQCRKDQDGNQTDNHLSANHWNAPLCPPRSSNSNRTSNVNPGLSTTLDLNANCPSCSSCRDKTKSVVRYDFHQKWRLLLLRRCARPLTQTQRHPCPALLLCLRFLCCGAWITPGISRILAAPIDGTEMTVPIVYARALTPCDFPGLKVAQTADYARATAGGRSHTSQRRLGWTNSSSAVWGHPTQTWRSVSHGPVQAGLVGCRRQYSALWKNNNQACICCNFWLWQI